MWPALSRVLLPASHSSLNSTPIETFLKIANQQKKFRIKENQNFHTLSFLNFSQFSCFFVIPPCIEFITLPASLNTIYTRLAQFFIFHLIPP